MADMGSHLSKRIPVSRPKVWKSHCVISQEPFLCSVRTLSSSTITKCGKDCSVNVLWKGDRNEIEVDTYFQDVVKAKFLVEKRARVRAVFAADENTKQLENQARVFQKFALLCVE